MTRAVVAAVSAGKPITLSTGPSGLWKDARLRRAMAPLVSATGEKVCDRAAVAGDRPSLDLSPAINSER